MSLLSILQPNTYEGLSAYSVVIYALRAKQAHTPSEDNSSKLTIYWQLSYAIGYLSMYSDLCTIMRTLFVKTTQGAPATSHTVLLMTDAENANLTKYNSPTDEDLPRQRFLYRRIFGISTVLSWVPVILGIVAGSNYPSAEKNASKASTIQTLRFVFLNLHMRRSC